MSICSRCGIVPAVVRRYFFSAEMYEPMPSRTLLEHKREAWGGMDQAYRITQPGPQPKQHRRIQRWSRTSPPAS